MENANKAIIALLLLLGGGGAIYLYKNKNKGQSLPPNGMTFDPGMDADTQTAINNALMNETNPTNLRQLALGCRSKGYVKAAAALEAKANSIEAVNSPLPGNTPSIPTNVGNNTVPVSPKDIPPSIGNILNTAIPGIGTPIPGIGTPAGNTNTTPASDPASTPSSVQVMSTAQLLADKALEAPMSVLQVQQALNAINPEYHLVEDGVNGPKTTNAVKSYQANKHLSVDGIPGPQTWKALRVDLLALSKAV